MKALKLIEEALTPLADAVFNDNHEITVVIPTITAEHCISAYWALKALHMEIENESADRT